MDQLLPLAIAIAVELALFAAVVFALFGTEDLLVDALFLSNVHRLRSTPARARAATTRRFAIFIPAWREAAVIGHMLAASSKAWAGHDIRFYVGVYPNDLATLITVRDAAARDPRIRVIINHEAGPTTKGACLNRLWQACRADQKTGGFSTDAVLLHDAEDLVDPAELAVLDRALDSNDFAQLPVVPSLAARSRWISGHYCDEFAEAHIKDLPVRFAFGRVLPLAGVGCAFRLDVLASIAGEVGPFNPTSLTEDYELGLRLSAAGARGAFVRQRTDEGRLVASRGYFPHQIDQAVRQKTRWLRGIAFDAWDRLGWIGPSEAEPAQRLAAYWMLWRDRRAAIAALAILCGYSAVLIAIFAYLQSPPDVDAALAAHPVIVQLFLFNLALLLWRIAVRAACTGHVYGWHHAPLAVLRIPISNIILVMTAWRAMLGHVRDYNSATAPVWDKTEHMPPVLLVPTLLTSEQTI
ncbi:MAG: glycosyl transferase family protein [Sphingopyxis sp.]